MGDHFLIVTINDNCNYGNRLQNYALSVLLSQYGKCDTVRCELFATNRFRQFLLPLHRFFSFVRNFILDFKTGSFSEVRKRRFNCSEFTNNYVDNTTYTVTSVRGLYPRGLFDGVVLGSDQVWNYRWLTQDGLAIRLGSFVPQHIPVISYAASFGVSDVDDETVEAVFRKYLPRLKAISVREDRGVELVRKLSEREAAVVLDPTLMLSTEQWNGITRGFVHLNDRYVLTYFLGYPSEAQERVIQEQAKILGCRVRRILDLRDKDTYVAGPQDFVELFSKAQYVFTDSYHACCFSILYHKQFTVFNRVGMEGKANMNSRMETLFRLFDLNSVVMDEGLAPRIDYEKVDQLLARHRAESQAWLDKAMTEEQS